MTTPAEELREAAQLMRERAKGVDVALTPAVALVMSDWLDFAAETARQWSVIGSTDPSQWAVPTQQAHLIARAYLLANENLKVEALTCQCCGQVRKTLPFHSERYGVTYCQECYDTGCSIGAGDGGCAL